MTLLDPPDTTPDHDDDTTSGVVDLSDRAGRRSAGPPARADRWRPTRAGIVSLWRYWDETFRFHNGRLLLRGPNGSGKSMALELLLPFLLDGDTSPHKLSSAAKARGTLASRVLAGTTDATRAGFVWIEFRRGDDTFTVGARIRASQSTGKADRQLFTTTLRVGDDLHLLDDGRSPISRKELDERIGTTGRVTDSATEHRDAVRRALFPTFSIDRYDSLIGALLSLRREKLSQNLDLPKLSSVLSEALPPLDDHDIAEVAEGFERLDRRRADIAELERDLDQVGRLVGRQRSYARAVISATTGAVVSAESNRDSIVRTRRTAGEALEAIEKELAQLVAESDDCQRRVDDAGAALLGIRDSALYQEGAQLAELRNDRDRQRRTLGQRAADVDRHTADHDTAVDRHAEATADVGKATASVGDAWAALRSLSDQLGAESALPPSDEALTDGIDADAHARVLRAWVADRRTAIKQLRGLVRAHEDAVHDRDGAEARREDARQEAVDRHRELADALTAHTEAVAAYVDAVAQWSTDPAFTDTERRDLDTARLADEPCDAVAAAVSAMLGTRRSATAVQRGDLAGQRRAVDDERSELVEARRLLEAGSLPDPESPAWRTPRTGLSGAPFWRLVDVADDADAATVDAVEAALVAAGLADAWVRPDGSVLSGDDAGDTDRADVVLTAATPADGPNLGALLVPAADVDEVATEVVAAVLAAIPLVDTAEQDAGPGVAIGRDGSFRLGSAVGRGRRDHAATLLGAAARERHRQAELARLTNAIDDADRRLTELDRQDRAAADALAAFEALGAMQPARGGVDDATRTHRDAEVRATEADRASTKADGAVAAAEQVVKRCQLELHRASADASLPTRAEELDDVEEVVGHLAEASGTWVRRSAELTTAARIERERADALTHIADSLHRATEEHERQAAFVRSLETRLASLEDSIGTELEELLQRERRHEDERRAADERLRQIRDQRPPLEKRAGKCEQQVDEAEQRLTEAEAHRRTTHDALAALVAGSILADAGVDIEVPATIDGPTTARDTARRLAAAVDASAADATSRRSRAVEETLHSVRTEVAGRIELIRSQPDGTDWFEITGAVGGIRRPLADVRARLDHDLDAARDELDADEAELFERTLAGSIRSSLADRIRAANTLVDTINAQLDQVRTKAGVGVRLQWRVGDDQPPAVRAARNLLLRDPGDLEESEQESLREFVRARVDQARDDAELHAPWEARLRESLDYRRWHEFGLQVSHRDWVGFKPATAGLIQKLSTGERSVALHLPMLASITAHYADGHGGRLDCPRLILLDELFAGVDADNRAQLFGTFTDWDLDTVLTSDHEWCAYASLDAMAIHQLTAGGDLDPVTSVRFTWDGRHRALDDE